MGQINITWKVPGQCQNGALIDAGPTVQVSRDGLTGVVTRIPYALVGVDPDDGTTDFISHSVGLGDPNPATFVPVATVDQDGNLVWSVDHATLVGLLQNWLFSACPEVTGGVGALNRADQEQQLTKKIRDKQSTQSAMALPSA